MGDGILTRRQREILNFIASFAADHGYPPTVREIGEALEIYSTNAVADHLNALERKGRISRDPGKARALRVVGGLE